ncbi:MAG: cytochrome b5-like heme/steroid binding domain-containing protein [Acidimicrobiales bacterium]
MRWLVALTLALLLGTIAVTSVAGLVTDQAEPAGRALTPVITAAPVGTADSPALTAPALATPAAADPATTPTSTTTQPATSFAELTAHDSIDDCWLAIGGNAYDVTGYIQAHPGGSRTIIPWCGLEATVAFLTEDGRGEHSEEAEALLREYLIGPLSS